MIILKRTSGGVETFELPEESLAEIRNLCAHPADKTALDPMTAAAIDLFKLEYERCVQRYNDLYNSAWTNFSYMALVAGGIITFGGAKFVTSLTLLLACLPLLFWWAATFVPLNRYGDDVQKEIVRIEEALLAIGVFAHLESPANEGLQHFKNFSRRITSRKPTASSPQQSRAKKALWRVRNVVSIAATALIIITLICFWVVVKHVRTGGIEALIAPDKPGVTVIVPPSPTPQSR